MEQAEYENYKEFKNLQRLKNRERKRKNYKKRKFCQITSENQYSQIQYDNDQLDDNNFCHLEQENEKSTDLLEEIEIISDLNNEYYDKKKKIDDDDSSSFDRKSNNLQLSASEHSHIPSSSLDSSSPSSSRSPLSSCSPSSSSHSNDRFTDQENMRNSNNCIINSSSCKCAEIPVYL